MKAPTVVCVLRSGGEYKLEHAQHLLSGIEQHWPADQPLRQLVLTDMTENKGASYFRPASRAVFPHEDVEVISLLHGWPKWWAKMELFRPTLDEFGDLLFFDLDTVIVGDLQDIVATKTLTVLQDFYRVEKIGSGMMYIPVSVRARMWKRWSANPGVHMRSYRGDQEFLYPSWQDKAERWQSLLPGQVVSYKVHIMRSLSGEAPPNARVVCFHGRPRPWAVRWPQQSVVMDG